MCAPAPAADVASPSWADDGGCSVCRFYDYGGYDYLTPSFPVDMCGAVLPSSQSVACAGWNYWDRTRVWKSSGGWIRVGFWHRDIHSGTVRMEFRLYGEHANGQVLTVDRTDVGGSAYNVSTCGYDFDHGGPSSYVLCEAIHW